jgi:hypothetical protein
MRMWALLALPLLIVSPVCAQTIGTTSGSTAVINSSEPASTTSRVISAPTVVAPGLAAAGVETCLGSASGGLSAMGGGFTFGTTTVDEGCSIRLLARQLYAFGFQKAALALMCEDQHVVAAMSAAGSPCPRSLFAAATEPAQHSFLTAPNQASPRSFYPGATEAIPYAADNEPSLLSFFAAIFQPSPTSVAPEQRVRESGIN